MEAHHLHLLAIYDTICIRRRSRQAKVDVRAIDQS